MSLLFRKLWKVLRARPSGGRPPPPSANPRPAVECLEDRYLLASGLALDLTVPLHDLPAAQPRGLARLVDLGELNTGLGFGATSGAILLVGAGAGRDAAVTLVLVNDVNADGLSDLILDSGRHLLVALGRPDGTYQTSFRLDQDGTWTEVVFRALGDFNGDGELDFLTVDGTGGAEGMTLVFGNGDGTFRTETADSTANAGAMAQALARLLGSAADRLVTWRPQELADGPDLAAQGLTKPLALAAETPAPVPKEGSELPFPDGDVATAAAPPLMGPELSNLSNPNTEPGTPPTLVNESTAETPSSETPQGGALTSEVDNATAAPGIPDQTKPEEWAAVADWAVNQADADVVVDERLPLVPASLPVPFAGGAEPSETARSVAVVTLARFCSSLLVPPGSPPPPGRVLGGAELRDDVFRHKLVPLPDDPEGVVEEIDLNRLDGPSPADDPSGDALSWKHLLPLLAEVFYATHLTSPADGTAQDAAPGLLQPTDPPVLAAEFVRQMADTLGRLVEEFYRQFLGRTPLIGEERGWVDLLLGGRTQEEVLGHFLGTVEFYQRATTLAAGTPDECFVQALYQVLLERAPSAAELGAGLVGLATQDRPTIAASLLRSVEFRTRYVHEQFRAVLGRDATPSEASSWARSPFDLLTIRTLLATRAPSIR